MKGLHLIVSNVVKDAWLDPRSVAVPPHLMHPIVSHVGDIIVALEDATKKKSKSAASSSESGCNLSDYFRNRRRRA